MLAPRLNGAASPITLSFLGGLEEKHLRRRTDRQLRLSDEPPQREPELFEPHQLGSPRSTARVGEQLETVRTQSDPSIFCGLRWDEDCDKQECPKHVIDSACQSLPECP